MELKIPCPARRVAPLAQEKLASLREMNPVRHEVQDVTGAPAEVRRKVRQFVQGISSEERMLVVLKAELYQGSWDDMVADLRARLEGKPYIFKLAHRIADDLERIERLRAFEESCRVDLSDYVKMET